MRDKIFNIIENVRHRGEKTNKAVIDILALLKQEGLKSPEEIPDCEICLERNEDMMRDKGWLHKTDNVKGLKVIKKCRDIVSYDIGPNKERRLTIGEALEQIQIAYKQLEIIKWGVDRQLYQGMFNYELALTKALATKDGGRIVREE